MFNCLGNYTTLSVLLSSSKKKRTSIALHVKGEGLKKGIVIFDEEKI
jgi:redox-regulated HSP33 family molecular chaperone